MVTLNNSSDHQVTQYNVVTGGASNVLNNVAPSATSGVPLIAQGASAQPVFGTALVAGGGTGAVTLTGVLIGNGTSAVTGNAVTQYDVLVGGSANTISSIGPGTSGQILQSGGESANPAYSTSTYPTTNAINTLLYASAANTMAELATANNGILITSASGVPSILADGTTGQVLTATTGAPPAWANAPSTAFPWTVVNTNQICAVTNGYIASATSAVNLTVPNTAAIGNEIKFANIGSGFNIVPGLGQTVSFLAQSASLPNALQSTSANAAADIICTNANTSWNVINNEGTFSTVLLTGLLQGSVGLRNLAYLKGDGSAWMSGDNTFGQIGNQTALTTSYSSPVSVVGGNAYIGIFNGGFSAIAIRNDNTLWAWGENNNGQLGTFNTTSYSSPVSVVGAISWSQVCINASSALALDINGHAWGWGLNNFGELGNNTRTRSSSPVSVVGAHTFIQIAQGNEASYGLKSNGQVWAWGENVAGGLGNLTHTSFSSPISVVGAFNFTQITANEDNAYGLDTSGHVWSWGYNIAGQLGNLTVTSTSSPISVVGAHSFVQISSGVYTCYGLKSNGQVWAWGKNDGGQLGNNTTTGASSPISVVGAFSFVKLLSAPAETGSQSMGAYDSLGQIWAWGFNGSGEIANNTLTSYSSPVLVLNTP